MKLVSRIPGVDLRSEMVEGKGSIVNVLHCSTCDAEEVFRNGTNGAPLPQEFLFKKARQLGWNPHNKGKHKCPKCMEVNVTDTAPREMTVAERRRIFREIDESYDEANSRYCDDITDHTIAQKLDVPRKWVSDMREDNFGPSGENVEMERVATLLGRVDGEFRAAIDDCLAAAAKAEKLHKEVQDAKNALTQIKKAVGPHRAA